MLSSLRGPHWGGCEDAVHSLTHGGGGHPKPAGLPVGALHTGASPPASPAECGPCPTPRSARGPTLWASEPLHVSLLCSVHLDVRRPHRRFRRGHAWARGACSCCHAPEPCGGSAVRLLSTRVHLVVFLGGDAEGGSRDETRCPPVAKGRASGTRWHLPLSCVFAQLNHGPTFSP